MMALQMLAAQLPPIPDADLARLGSVGSGSTCGQPSRLAFHPMLGQANYVQTFELRDSLFEASLLGNWPQQFLLAVWLSLLLLVVIDRRESSRWAKIALASLVLLLSGWAVWLSQVFPSIVCWWSSTLVAGLTLLWLGRLWLRTEHPSKLRSASLGPTVLLASLGTVIGVIGVCLDCRVAGITDLFPQARASLHADATEDATLNKTESSGRGASDTSSPSQAPPAAPPGKSNRAMMPMLSGYPVIHLFSSIGLLAISLVSAFELAFLSHPESLNSDQQPQVAWRWLAAVALVAAVFNLIAVVSIFLAPVAEELAEKEINQLPMQVIARLFGLTLMVVAAITWMIPHRVATFQKRQQSAQGWISLSIAAWIALVAWGMILALPSRWPWSIL
jgi:hypothetical protein